MLLWVWFLSFFGFTRGNYNFSDNLRRISLIEERVSEDLNIYNFYKKMFMIERSMKRLFEKRKLNPNLIRLYMKKVFHEGYDHPQFTSSSEMKFLYRLARYNDLSDWEI